MLGNGTENRQFIDPLDEIRETLVHENYFAQADIDFCLAYEIAQHSAHANFTAMQELHNALLSAYKREDEHEFSWSSYYERH